MCFVVSIEQLQANVSRDRATLHGLYRERFTTAMRETERWERSPIPGAAVRAAKHLDAAMTYAAKLGVV